MAKYLGEEQIDCSTTLPFCSYSQAEWICDWIERYKGIDGEHHKHWLLDQIVRISCGQKVQVFKATWDDGVVEYRPRLSPDTPGAYVVWVRNYEQGGMYEYTVGTSP